MDYTTICFAAAAVVAAQLTTLAVYTMKRCRRSYSQQTKMVKESIKETEKKVEKTVKEIDEKVEKKIETATVLFDSKVQELENKNEIALDQIRVEDRRLNSATSQIISQILRMPNGSGYATFGSMGMSSDEMDTIINDNYEFKKLSELIKETLSLKTLKSGLESRDDKKEKPIDFVMRKTIPTSEDLVNSLSNDLEKKRDARNGVKPYLVTSSEKVLTGGRTPDVPNVKSGFSIKTYGSGCKANIVSEMDSKCGDRIVESIKQRAREVSEMQDNSPQFFIETIASNKMNLNNLKPVSESYPSDDYAVIDEPIPTPVKIPERMRKIQE